MRVTPANTMASWPAPLTSTGAGSVSPLLPPPLLLPRSLPRAALPAEQVLAGARLLSFGACCASSRCSSGSASATASANRCRGSSWVCVHWQHAHQPPCVHFRSQAGRPILSPPLGQASR